MPSPGTTCLPQVIMASLILGWSHAQHSLFVVPVIWLMETVRGKTIGVPNFPLV